MLRNLKRAFTLIEMVVVISIIVIVIALAIPSTGRMMASANLSKDISTIKLSLAVMQSYADGHGVTAGIRIERAFKINKNGMMIKDDNGEAIWKDYQRIVPIVRGEMQHNKPISGNLGYPVKPHGYAYEPYAFCRVQNQSVLELSKDIWAAPLCTLDNLATWNVKFVPTNPDASPFNLMETFYILFDHHGELVKETNFMHYIDTGQSPNTNGVWPAVDQPNISTRGGVLYNRGMFNTVPTEDTLQRSFGFLVNRFGKVIISD